MARKWCCSMETLLLLFYDSDDDDDDDIGYLLWIAYNHGLLGSLSVVSRGSTVRHPFIMKFASDERIQSSNSHN